MNPSLPHSAETISARDLFTSIDWSRTPLGPFENWSARLRATVEVVLANRYPMIVLWGPSVVHVAYNDAYAVLIGKRHPRAMGESNETIWPEVWHINGPIYAAIYAEGREFYFEDALYPLDRNEWREEVYLTIAYAPIREDDDRIIGILVTMVETTRNVLAERRLRSLSELASRIARVRSIAEIGPIAASTLAENPGDLLFVAIYGAHDGRVPAAGAPLLGSFGIDPTDADDLAVLASAVLGDGGSSLMTLGRRANGAAYAAQALGQPVREAYLAALPRGSAAGPSGFLIVGLSPALPRDARYWEYLEFVRAQLAVAFENATTFDREHRIADTLQRAALPGGLPVVRGLAVDAVYETGRAEALIGGDWYDAFVLRDGRVVLSIGDVSGSGVVAAAAMGAARQMIRGLAQMLDNPVEILNAVDRAFRLERDSAIITAWVGFLRADFRELCYASAGHPAPFVRRSDGAIELLWAPDLPIGLRDEVSAEPARVRIDDGCIIVLYTDGLTEATRDPVEGERRLAAAIADRDFATAANKAAFIYDRVLDSRANDDVALLVVELHEHER